MEDLKKQNNHAEQENAYTLNRETMDSIIAALADENYKKLHKILEGLHSGDVAEAITALDSGERKQFTDAVGDELDPEALVDLDPEVKDEIIDNLGARDSASVIRQLDTDDAVQVMEDLEEQDQKDILGAIPAKERKELREGLAHPEDSAGRLMDKKFVAVPKNWTVGQTIDYMRETEDLPEDFYSVFVLDKKGKPVGNILVSRVMRNNREVKIRNIMDTDLKTISLDMDQEEVAYIFQKYALSSAPVLDKKGVMIGRITIDDALDVLEEEAEEDIMRLAGVKATDIHSASTRTAMHRFPWLFVNLLTAIAASVIIAIFEESIQKLVALAVLMPIVASMAGNAGTQTLTIAVRAIATKELTSNNAFRVVRKEILASILNGFLFAIIVGVASLVLYNNQYLSFVFATATFVSLVIAAFAGALIPMILANRGVDPAVASSVFLTTVTDMSAFFIFLGMASWMII